MSFHSGRTPSLERDSFSGNTSHSHRQGMKMVKIAPSRRQNRGKARALCKNYGHNTAINMLPDDALFEIFDFYRNSVSGLDGFKAWNWHGLVQVCQRWRRIIFASPRGLHLQLRCTHGTIVRKKLGYWPVFPLEINYNCCRNFAPNDEDGLFAALQYPNRVRGITLIVQTGSLLAKMTRKMRESFPALTCLRLSSPLNVEDLPVLPDRLLGGSAPRLQELRLQAVPFPNLPTLLVSARDLVSLQVIDIPPTGHISPEAMVMGLAALSRLRSLSITFRRPTLRPERKYVPRTALPALTSFLFRGVSDYLEDLVARIDCPRLDRIEIEYWYQRVGFQVSELFKFISRSEDPKLTFFEKVQASFANTALLVYHENTSDIAIRISLIGSEWEFSHISHMFSEFSGKLSDVRHLSIGLSGRYDPDEIGRAEWVQLLRPFTAVQMLCVHGFRVEHVALALEDVAREAVAEVLPALDLLCLDSEEGLVPSLVKFDVARWLSGHPVTIVRSVREFEI